MLIDLTRRLPPSLPTTQPTAVGVDEGPAFAPGTGAYGASKGSSLRAKAEAALDAEREAHDEHTQAIRDAHGGALPPSPRRRPR